MRPPQPGRAPAPLAQTFAQTLASDEERVLDARVTLLLQRFLGSDRVTSDAPLEALHALLPGVAAPAAPTPPEDYIARVIEPVVEHSINTASPRYIGHMTTALPYFARPLSRLVAGLNQNPVKVETAKSVTPLEREALAMLHRLVFGRDDAFYREHAQARERTLGILTGGGTAANITALWIARNAALGPRGELGGVEREGLAAALADRGHRRAVILGSALMHYSMEKAADVLGLGASGLCRVEVDRGGRVRVERLRRAIEERRARGDLVLAVVGVAGATDTGSIDPLDELAALASEAGVHFHVDAAWGGPLLFSRRHRGKLFGIGRADTVTIDGHKQLYLPMGIGAVVMRAPDAALAIEKQAPYIIRRGSPDLGRRSLEGSRPAMALLLHAGLHLIGGDAYEELIDAGVARAQAMAAAVRRRPAFELLGEPHGNIVNYRYVPPALRGASGRWSLADNEVLDAANLRLQEAQSRAGRSFVSRTTLGHTGHGQGAPIVALRAVLANPLTTLAQLEEILDEQEAIALSSEGGGAP
ncbi:aminotransferase class V-fold PLP-dependent enzyme [Sorangium sp. So ce341]|uniref:aminotransferase class V-fold PLP-dependent enzyme n=1 Tax=Sorangium sp. So ce341 TaxID=3133302 RepID=UPI003F632814